jgi:PAS domain S-box-containing protein
VERGSIRAAVLTALLAAFAAGVQAQSYLTRIYGEDDGLPSSSVYDIAQDSRGLMWFATRQGVVAYDGSSWEPHTDPGQLPPRDTDRIRVDARGRIWFLSRAQTPWLSYCDGRTFGAIPDPPDGSAGRTTRLSLALLEENGQTTVAVGSEHDGLFIWSRGAWRHITTREGLPGDGVRALAADGDRLWVGTSGGLAAVVNGSVDATPGRLIRSPSSAIEALATEVVPPPPTGTAATTRLWVVGVGWLGALERGAFTLAATGLAISADPDNPGAALWGGTNTVFFGTFHHLFAFDVEAREVRPFGRLDGLVADGATALFRDREGTLWVGGARGVSKVASRRFANFATAQGLLDDEVTAICEVRPGELVLGHNRGVTRIAGSSFKAVPFDSWRGPPGRDPRVLELVAVPDGSVWVAASERGLGQLLPSGEVRWFREQLGVTDSVNSVAIGPNGALLVASDTRVALVDPKRPRVIEVTFSDPAVAVRRIVAGPDGQPAIATISHGLLVRHEGAWRPLASGGPPSGRSVYCSRLDSRGRYWVGTNAGLLTLADGKLAVSQAPAISRPVYFIVEDRGGDLWLGTDRGVARWDGELTTTYSVREGLAGPETNRAAGLVDSAGKLWIGTNRGVSRFQPEYDGLSAPPPLVEVLPPIVDGRTVAGSGTVRLTHSQNNLTFPFRVLSFIDEDAVLVRTELEGFDAGWSAERRSRSREVRYTNLPPGRFRFLLSARTAAGVWSDAVASPPIVVLSPYWKTWWFGALASLAAAGALIGVHRFLTQRRYTVELAAEVQRRTEQLRASEERYRHLFDRSGVVKLLLDAGSGAIVDANEAASEFYAYSHATLLASSIGDLSAQPAEELQRRLRRAGAQQRSHFQSRHRLADGKLRDVEVYATPLEIDGRLLINIIVQDVTEKRRLEEDRHRASKLESIGLLAGGIAHDFNNVLAAIVGFVSAAKLRASPDQPIYRTLEAAEAAAVRATRLTKQLLTFAKGGAPVKRVAALGPIIREATGLALAGSNVRCAFSAPDDLWNAEVDEGQIGQVIHNLVLNAVQAMPDGGAVTVSAANVTRDSAPSSAGAAGDELVEITVRDEGVGIAPGNLGSIFDPYFTTKKSGSGLGLATSYSIVKAHRGEIAVASRLGAGTTFTVRIPASRAAPPVSPAAATGVVGGRGRILVMDDEEQVRDAYREVLMLLGYRVDLARDGREAIELFADAIGRDAPFAAVILDLTVPGGLGGRDTVRELRKLDPDVKAIVASGYVDDSILANPGDAGFCGVLTKPYTIDELSQTLQRVIAVPAEIQST